MSFMPVISTHVRVSRGWKSDAHQYFTIDTCRQKQVLIDKYTHPSLSDDAIPSSPYMYWSVLAMTSTQFPLDHAKYHDCLNTSWLAILESIMAIKWKPPQKALSFPPQLLLFGNRVVWWSGHCNATSAASPYPPQALPQSRSPDWSGILAFLSLYLSFSSSITTATTWAICKPPQTRHTTMSSFATPSPHSPRPFFKRPAYPSFKVGRVGKL